MKKKFAVCGLAALLLSLFVFDVLPTFHQEGPPLPRVLPGVPINGTMNTTHTWLGSSTSTHDIIANRSKYGPEWNVTHLFLYLSNIEFENYIYSENDHATFSDIVPVGLTAEVLRAFEVPTSCNLVSLKVKVKRGTSSTAIIRIYAAYNNSGEPAPTNTTIASQTVDLEDDATVLTVEFNVFLNTSKTFNKVFYVGITSPELGYITYFYNSSLPEAWKNYQRAYDGSISYLDKNIYLADITLEAIIDYVNLSVNNTPAIIVSNDIAIIDSQATDISSWKVNSPVLFLNVSSSAWPAEFNYDYRLVLDQYRNDTFPTTYESVESDKITYWNVSINCSEFPYFLATSVEYTENYLVLHIPTGWTLEDYSSQLTPYENRTFSVVAAGIAYALYYHNYSLQVSVFRHSFAYFENISSTMLAYLADNLSVTVTPFYNKVPASNGIVNLAIYNVTTVYYNVTHTISDGTANFTIDLNSTLPHRGNYTMEIRWYADTAAGKETRILHVYANMTLDFIPEKSTLQSSGYDDIVAVYNYSPLPVETIPPDSVYAIKVESNVSSLSYSLSYVTPFVKIKVFVSGLDNGTYYVHMLIGADYCESRWANFTFNISGVFPSNVTVRGGAIYVSGRWEPSPQPYVNDTASVELFYYNSLTGEGLLDAVVTAEVPPELADTGLAYPLLRSLYNGSTETLGLYKLIINTSAIHANREYLVNYIIKRAGYVQVTLQFRIIPCPIPLSANLMVDKIVEYENISYEFGITITDYKGRVLTGELGDKISVSWFLIVNEKINDSGTFEPFLTTWKTVIPLPVAGNHTLQIRVIAEDCETLIKNVSVIVLPKELIHVSLPPIGEVMEGSQLPLNIQLRYENGSPATNIPVKIRIRIGLNEYTLTTASDDQGHARVIFNVPTGVAPFDVKGVEFVIEVEIASSNPAIKSGVVYTGQGIIISTNTVVARGLPYIISAVVGSIASVVVYQKLYRAPRIRKRREEEAALEKLFLDLSGLKYVIILEKNTAVALVEYSIDTKRKADPQLISGFISAISSFGEEISGSTGMAGIEYKDFYLAMVDGERIRAIFALRERPSDEFNERALKMVQEFEKKFRNELEKFMGNISVFASAGELIEEIMDLWLVRFVELSRGKAKGVSKDTLKAARLLAGDIGIFKPSQLVRNATSIGKSMGAVVRDLFIMKNVGIIRPLSMQELMEKVQVEMRKIGEQREKITRAMQEGRIEEEAAQREVARLRAKLEALITLIS